MKKLNKIKIDVTSEEGITKLLSLVNEDMILLREGLASLCNQINRIRAFDKILMRVMDKAGIIDESDLKNLSNDLYKKQAGQLIQKYKSLRNNINEIEDAYDTMNTEHPDDFIEDDFDEEGNPVHEAQDIKTNRRETMMDSLLANWEWILLAFYTLEKIVKLSPSKKDDIIFDSVIKPIWDKLPFGK